MDYHILLTEICNLKCRYCYGKSWEENPDCLKGKFEFDFSEPEHSKINLKKLKGFLEKDENPVLIFYGGEPLLRISQIKKIMDSIDVPFRIQTNGILLDKLEPKYLNRIGKMLVSIDGNKERTDMNRGAGTFDKVIKNISLIKKKGYSGEIVARMTIAQDCPDVFEQVLNLVELGFTSVHWQLDSGFYSYDFESKKIKDFFEKYNSSVKKLLDWWMNEIRRGRVWKFYPFVGIMESLLKNEKTKLRCGAGHSGYAITTSGKVVACPIMNCIKDFECGNLNSNPRELKKIDVSGNCLGCDYLGLCGGRCLYWNKSRLWPEEGNDLICDSIKFLIDELKSREKEIRELISGGIVSIQDFDYEKYFGPEIIP
jgi:putative peptide-modifying radical SAM enzyme